MSGGQQGGPMMGGGKGGTQQMPSGGGKGGPQGHMMPNGQRQQRPGMGGPMSGNMGQPQQPGISSWEIQNRPGQTELGGFGPSMPQTYPGEPQANFGMSQAQVGPAGGTSGFDAWSQAQMRPPGSPPQQMLHPSKMVTGVQQMPQPGSYPQDQGPSTGMIGGQPAQFHYQAQGLNQGQPQQQPRQLSGLLAKLYGG